MIICFSGTGNTRLVADKLASELGESVLALDYDTPKILDLAAEPRVIWMFPIHSWGIPKFVRRFIREVSIVASSNLPHFMVCTCGDDAGRVADMWRKDLRQKGYKPVAAHSVFMPNTYVSLPGFDVDSPELEQQKLEVMPMRVETITHAIKCSSPIDDVFKGRFSWIKTKVIYPFFMRWLTSPQPFRASGACVACSRCEQVCPLGNIKVTGKPEWGNDCTMCMACYHACPRRAIDYGTRTRGKGQSSRLNVAP